MWTVWGVATMPTSGFASGKRRPSSSIPARVFNATSRSSAPQASAIAIPPMWRNRGKNERHLNKKVSSPFMGRWREAPEGQVHLPSPEVRHLNKQVSSPFMGRWPAGPEGQVRVPSPEVRHLPSPGGGPLNHIPILSTHMDLSPLRLTEY